MDFLILFSQGSLTDVTVGLVSVKHYTQPVVTNSPPTRNITIILYLYHANLPGLGAFLVALAAKLKDACLTLSADGLKLEVDFGLEAAQGALGIFDFCLSAGCSLFNNSFPDKVTLVCAVCSAYMYSRYTPCVWSGILSNSCTSPLLVTLVANDRLHPTTNQAYTIMVYISSNLWLQSYFMWCYQLLANNNYSFISIRK